MNLTAFVDESIDQDAFVMAGYVARDEQWAKFSAEWEEMLPMAVLNARNSRQFKMAQMAGNDERMARVAAFYRIIERHAHLLFPFVASSTSTSSTDRRTRLRLPV
jgi:hypothetical protein